MGAYLCSIMQYMLPGKVLREVRARFTTIDAKLMNRRAHKRRSASEKLGQVVTKAKGSGIHHGQKAKDAKRRKK